MATELKSQVFLSFKGKDTGKTFADHLYEALLGVGFVTLRGGDENDGGEEIKLELQKGIKESGVSVIIFSNDYVSSSWCLDELVTILDCHRISRRAVLPIFYHVDPSDVRKQKGRIGEAFDRHEELGGNQSGNEWKARVTKWKEALKEVADLGGMVLQNQADGHESKFIQKILKVVENKLSRPVLYIYPHLIGIERRVEKINSWLEDGSADVDTLVICGIGGIGKTTMAKYVYNLNFSKFDGCSFLSNIRENSTHRKGLVTLQRQFLSDICKRKKKPMFSVDEGMTEMRDAVSCKRILLILDDVDSRDQLEALLEMKDLLCPGSKVIVTTRNKRLLRPFDVHKLYEFEALNRDESVELLSWHAFGQDCPVKGFAVCSEQVAIHCGGLPLALEVLGATLAGRNIDIWKSTVQKLETIPNHQILRKLAISYESLEDDHDKNLFLHLACFFIGKDRDLVIAILNRCNFYTVIGIENLIDRNFVKISESNRLIMHQMIRDMGRDIVRQESPVEPGKRSRLWRSKDSFNVLIQNRGLYQPGVFSTFVPGDHVPSWFSSKYTKESCTSFKVPTCNSRIEGLSFCIVYKCSSIGLSLRALHPPRLTPPSRISPLAMRKAQGRTLRYRPVENKPYESTFDCPCITVNNLTRSLKWSYQPLFYGVPEVKEGMMWLSHWKLENQLSSDDVIEITVTSGDGITVMEFGIKIVPKVLGEPTCEDASRERDIVNPFWDVVLGDASLKNTCSVRLPPTYRSIRATREPFMEKALKRNLSDFN